MIELIRLEFELRKIQVMIWVASMSIKYNIILNYFR